MPQKVPPLEVSKQIILKAKGAPWLKEAEAKFNAQYRGAVEPNLAMWMIGHQAGLEMPEIKAASGAAESPEITVMEMNEKARDPKSQGWTFVNGGKFEKPESQDKYSILGVYLKNEESETQTGKDKVKVWFTDGTGVAKIGAIGAAADAFVESGAKPGSVIRLPLVQVNYGYHNFSKEKNKLWWNFSLPPFDDATVEVVDEDPANYFDNLATDPEREGRAAFMRGFITNCDEEEHEICGSCKRWVTERNQHEKCQEEAEKKGKEYESYNKTFIIGTGVTLQGQTKKLNFEVKPKSIKWCVDEVEIFGVINKVGSMDVAFVRKVGADRPVEAAAPAPKAKATAKPVVKAKAAPPPPVEEAEEEEQQEEEEAPTPPPAPKPKAKVAPKKPAPPPLEPEEEEEASYAPDGFSGDSDPSEEPEEAPVVVKAATKTAVAAKKPLVSVKAKAQTVQVEQEAGEVPEAVVAHIKRSCQQFGGKNRLFVLARTACKAGLLADQEGCVKDCKDETVIAAHREQMTAYCKTLVAERLAEYSQKDESEIKWIG